MVSLLQSAYDNRHKPEYSEVVDLVKEKVVDHFGETQHDEDARKLVQNAHEKMNRMPLDKASCTTPFGPAHISPAFHASLCLRCIA